MSDDPNAELAEVFAQELVELLEELQKSLMDLESHAQGPERTNRMNQVFRIAHTIKGSAATVGRDDLANVAHALESALDGVRQGQVPLTAELVSAVLTAVDTLSKGADAPLDEAAQRAAILLVETPLHADKVSPLVVQTPVASASPVAPPAVATAGARPPARKRRKPTPRFDARALLPDLLLQLQAWHQEASAEASDASRALAAQIKLGVSAAASPLASRISHDLSQLLDSRPKASGLSELAWEAAALAVDVIDTDLSGGASEDEALAVERLVKEAQLPTPPSPTAPTDPATEGVPRAPTATSRPEATVRIPIVLLDSILYRLDELTAVKLRLDYQRRQIEVAQEELEQLLAVSKGEVVRGPTTVEGPKRKLEFIRRELSQDVHYLGIVAQGLQEDVKEVRMVPLSPALEPLRRLVRDLAQSLGKQARLELDVEGVRVDKQLLEMVRDPLTHLLRNSVDHGMETPAKRVAAHKPPCGELRIKAETRDSQVWIEITDDGRGISTDQVRRAALERGLIDGDRARAMTDREVLNLIFSPGFSTAKEVTAISGRGVGLDVVRENVGKLGGRIEFFTEAGKGTQFNLCLPLTLSASRGLMVIAGGRTYCVPLAAVEEVLVTEPDQIGLSQGRLAMQWRRQAVSYVGLQSLLDGSPSTKPTTRVSAVILALSDQRLAIGVDELLGQEEVVIRGVAAGTPPLPFVSGATSLADGRLVTVLEPGALIRAASRSSGRLAMESAEETPTVLVVDDSLTSRTMIASVLDRAGYRTIMAHDGERAVAMMRENTVDLVVSDVEMPVLDGIGLVRNIRASSTPNVPVILITSLGTAADRARGAEAGANGYLVKQSFDPSTFLGMVSDYIGGRDAA